MVGRAWQELKIKNWICSRDTLEKGLQVGSPFLMWQRRRGYGVIDSILRQAKQPENDDNLLYQEMKIHIGTLDTVRPNGYTIYILSGLGVSPTSIARTP